DAKAASDRMNDFAGSLPGVGPHSRAMTCDWRIPPAGPGMDAGGGGIPPSQLALRTDLRAAGRIRGRVLRDERGEPAVRAPHDNRFRLRADARPGSSSPVRLLILRR